MSQHTRNLTLAAILCAIVVVLGMVLAIGSKPVMDGLIAVMEWMQR